jgi:hypothetical protein
MARYQHRITAYQGMDGQLTVNFQGNLMQNM